jgi:DNA-directed RNA polymerase subunit beta
VAADELPAGVNMLVRVYIAQKRKLMEGDKMAGRHGNKGVVSKIMPEEDMPFLPDGTPCDIVLNPLGVGARMNIGQILETHLGLVSHYLGGSFENPIFQARREADILQELQRLSDHLKGYKLHEFAVKELMLDLPSLEGMPHQPYEFGGTVPDIAAITEMIRQRLDALTGEDRLRVAIRLALVDSLILPPLPEKGRVDEEDEGQAATEAARPAYEGPIPEITTDEMMERAESSVNERTGFNPTTGKARVRDGRSGDWFDMPVTVGLIYIMKLAHLVDDKIHARSTGPYSLVTQQPLGGKAQFGGQRFGEMEVWALEAYGAAYTLQEILTIKSDDVHGRVKTYESIVKGDTIMAPGIPESFRILVNELQSLGLKVSVEDDRDRAIDLRDQEEDMDAGEGARRRAARRMMDVELGSEAD